MRTLCCIVFLITNFWGLSQTPSEFVQVFKDYDFSSGNYTLVVTKHDPKWLGNRIGPYSHFYIDDSSTLQKIKEEWVFKEEGEDECVYDYSLYLVDSSGIKWNALLRTGCGGALCSNGCYRFDCKAEDYLIADGEVDVLNANVTGLVAARDSLKGVMSMGYYLTDSAFAGWGT